MYYIDTFLEKIKINNKIHISYNNIIFYNIITFFYYRYICLVYIDTKCWYYSKNVNTN